MKILKPTAARQSEQKSEQKKRGKLFRKKQNEKNISKKNDRARGAVIQRPNKRKESSLLVFKKKVSDLFSELARVCIRNPIILVFSVFLVVITIVSFGVKGLKAEMPIERVSVKGDFYQIDKKVLEQTLAPLVGSNYVDVDIKVMKEKLMVFAWVESVEVRKIWPASLEVNVVENRAIATWGEDGFVNQYGKVFKPEQVEREYLTGLPDLNGLDKQSDLVLSTYVELAELSRHSEFKIVQFSLIANSYWDITFDQGSKILLARGRELYSFKIFLDAYKQNFSQSAQHIAKVDMRYNNGFSVEFSEKKVSEEKLGIKQPRAKQNMQAQYKNSTMKVGKYHG